MLISCVACNYYLVLDGIFMVSYLCHYLQTIYYLSYHHTKIILILLLNFENICLFKVLFLSSNRTEDTIYNIFFYITFYTSNISAYLLIETTNTRKKLMSVNSILYKEIEARTPAKAKWATQVEDKHSWAEAAVKQP